MADPMTPERPRCGTPCLKHAHACDRSPRHTGFHRDVQQKGDHACEWETPGPKDFPAVMAALRTVHAERSIDLEALRVAAVDLKHVRAERDSARAEVERLQGWLGDYETTQTRNAELKAEVEQLRARLDAAWTVVREGAANTRAQLATVRAERDEARTLAGVRGDLLDETRANLGRAQQAGRDAEAERDSARAEVERLRASADVIVGKSAAAVEDVARKVRQLADECARLAQDRAFVETVVAMWDAGGVAPRDVLAAIRDQLADRVPGEDTDGGEGRG